MSATILFFYIWLMLGAPSLYHWYVFMGCAVAYDLVHPAHRAYQEWERTDTDGKERTDAP